MSVATFEADRDRVRLIGRHDRLAQASAALPGGAYTTFRTYGGRSVVRFPRHVRRLERSVALEGRAAPLDAAAARRLVRAALDATGHPETRLRLTFSPPRLFVSVEPFSPLPRALYEAGAAAVTLPLRRDIPEAKDTRFIATAASAYARLPPGVEEGLLESDEGDLLEGLSSNLFAVLAGTLRTEEARALPGVTRSLVLEVAEGLLPVIRRAVRRDDLGRLSEAFLTSASRGVLPLVRIDGRAVGDGRVGEATRRIMAGFQEAIRREAETV
jgi:branched-chain amino acid aminotransferase